MTAHFGKFIAYYRVSTDKQGQSGLGLGRCDRRHKLLFEYPIIFWTP